MLRFIKLWYVRNYKVISMELASSLNLVCYRNIYGDEINRLNCRSIWVDKKGNEYRVSELVKRHKMKVVCIDIGSYHLTLGKTYDVVEISEIHNTDHRLFDYKITNDKGISHYVEGNLFIKLEDMREEKLNSLGI